MFKQFGSRIAAGFRKIPFGRLRQMFTWKRGLILLGTLLLLHLVFVWIFSREPDHFDVQARAVARGNSGQKPLVTGYVTTATLVEVTETVLNKRGGYLSNDIMPPFVFLDNLPSWEYGAITQIRDLAYTLRYDFSRSRTQSEENPALAAAQNHFNYNHRSWMLPSSEGEYRRGLRELNKYMDGLVKQNDENTQFYARADNLRSWLAMVEKQLGSMSQRLSASVGQTRINTDLAGEDTARQSTETRDLVSVKTPWMRIDNVFYESRGGTWALLHFLEAIQVDFDAVLTKKNAHALVRQIIQELRGAQRTVWSPVILNGGGFGLFANHSLVLASYLSRATAAIIDLRELLSEG